MLPLHDGGIVGLFLFHPTLLPTLLFHSRFCIFSTIKVGETALTKIPRKTDVELSVLGGLYFLFLQGTQSRSKEVILDILILFLAFLEVKIRRNHMQMFVLLRHPSPMCKAKGFI